jgi:hypothetical protein
MELETNAYCVTRVTAMVLESNGFVQVLSGKGEWGESDKKKVNFGGQFG